ncbi:hypothetical protein D3248_05960 [Leucobacter zeae]|nr:hypothetical protein [Leucobacter zeae]
MSTEPQHPSQQPQQGAPPAPSAAPHGAIPQGTPQQPQYAAPRQPAPQYAAPQYAEPPHTTPQYAAPQQPFAQGSGAARPLDRVNILGIVALALVAAGALLNVFIPFIYRAMAETGDIGSAISAVGTVQAVLHVIAAGLALAGVLQRNAPRVRWAAIGALVACALWVVSALGSLLTGWISASMY